MEPRLDLLTFFFQPAGSGSDCRSSESTSRFCITCKQRNLHALSAESHARTSSWPNAMIIHSPLAASADFNNQTSIANRIHRIESNVEAKPMHACSLQRRLLTDDGPHDEEASTLHRGIRVVRRKHQFVRGKALFKCESQHHDLSTRGVAAFSL